VSRSAFLLVIVLGALRDPCGTDTDAAGPNAPCTRTKDCENGLTCAGGVCSPLDGSGSDTGSDAGARDGNTAD
jgi:hypothetical protein